EPAHRAGPRVVLERDRLDLMRRQVRGARDASAHELDTVHENCAPTGVRRDETVDVLPRGHGRRIPTEEPEWQLDRTPFARRYGGVARKASRAPLRGEDQFQPCTAVFGANHQPDRFSIDQRRALAQRDRNGTAFETQGMPAGTDAA